MPSRQGVVVPAPSKDIAPPSTPASALADYLAAMYRFSNVQSTAATEALCVKNSEAI